MPHDIPSLTHVLEARRRAAEAVENLDADAALEALAPLDGEFPWPARAEIWDAMAKLGTPMAGSRLLLISETLTDKAAQKRMRQVIHQLRSRGVPVEMPPSSPAGAPGAWGLPPLRTWASCIDGEGAYQLLAHLHSPHSGLCGFSCFAVTRGAQSFVVFPVDSPRQVKDLLARVAKETETGMPPLIPIDPEPWIAIADHAMRDHAEGNFPDPEDLEMWASVQKAVATAVGPHETPPDPLPEAPEDPDEAAADLLDSPDYQAWFFDDKDLPEEMMKRAGDLVSLPPTRSRRESLDELVAEMLRTVDAERLKTLWQRGLRHNARVHVASDEPAAAVALWFAELFDRVPFVEHPLAREVARRSPWRLFGFPDEPNEEEALDRLWADRGWAARDGWEGRERLGVVEQFVDFWIGDQSEARRHRQVAMDRQWGRDGREFLDSSELTIEILLPATIHFHHWDFRRAHQSKTIAETLLPRIGEIPEEARPFFRGQVSAVTSLYQVLDVLEDGAVLVEDYLNDSQLIVEVRGLFTEETRGSYPLLIGKVFPVGRTNWLAMACPPLVAILKPLLVARLEGSLMGWPGRRATVDELRRKPQALWRALRAADEELTREEDRTRGMMETLPPPPGEPLTPLDIDALDDEDRARVLEAMKATLTRNYTRWMNESIPALGYRTPRRAAKDPQARRLLVDLLREMEAESRLNPFGMDFGDLFAKMRRELKLEG